jgi:hypothetical protein
MRIAIARRYPVGIHRGVEKLASRLAHNQKTAGAEPATATNTTADLKACGALASPRRWYKRPPRLSSPA